MVKHTQTIRGQSADELSVSDHFVGLALKGLSSKLQSRISGLIENYYNAITIQEISSIYQFILE